jgi:hypothetical protein
MHLEKFFIVSKISDKIKYKPFHLSFIIKVINDEDLTVSLYKKFEYFFFYLSFITKVINDEDFTVS